MFVFYLNIEVLVISLASGLLKAGFLLRVSMERGENRKPGVELEQRYCDKCCCAIVLVLLGERQSFFIYFFLILVFSIKVTKGTGRFTI